MKMFLALVLVLLWSLCVVHFFTITYGWESLLWLAAIFSIGAKAKEVLELA